MKYSLSERALLPHNGRIRPVHPSILSRAMELLRGCLFLPVTCFVWAVYIFRIAYLVAVAWCERSMRAKKLRRFLEAMID